MMGDKEIVNQWAKEPEKVFRQLMTKYKEMVYWHTRRLLVNHEDAQDATQETFVRIFRSLHDFKGDSSLKSWIYRIATNEALRLINKRCNDNVSLDDSQSEASRVVEGEYVDYSDLEAIKLQNAILTLPTKQQIAFNLRYYDELNYDEIAEVTNSTASAAKVNYHLAKEKIIQYMNSHD